MYVTLPCFIWCIAINCSPLVASSWSDYINIAIRLATDNDYYHSMRTHINNARYTAPLFDAQLWANHFIAAIRYIWHRHCTSLAPIDIDVANIMAAYIPYT